MTAYSRALRRFIRMQGARFACRIFALGYFVQKLSALFLVSAARDHSNAVGSAAHIYAYAAVKYLQQNILTLGAGGNKSKK